MTEPQPPPQPPPRARLDLRLAVPAAVAWAVLGVLLGIDGAPGPVAIVAGAVALGAVAVALWRRRPDRGGVLAGVALTSAACALLLLCAAASAGERRPPELLDAADTALHVTAEARLTQAVVSPGDGPVRVRAALDEVRAAGERHTVSSVPVTIFAPFAAPAEIGDRITVSGTLAETSPADASAFLLFARGEAIVEPGGAGPVAWAGGLRASFRGLVEGLPGQGAGLLPGLAIGDTSAVEPVLEDAMKASSLTHLTAVSGANCAVVVGLVLAAGGVLRMPLWARIAASVAALALFVLIVTPEPSVLRAAVMAVTVLVARLAGRGAAGVPVLALAVTILLAMDPWLARSYGFILSVFATAGLLVLAGPLADRLGRLLPSPIALVIAVPLAAQLACQPVLILLSPVIPVYGVIANLLAGPAAPMATVLGLVACMLAPVAPWLATPIVWLAWLPSAWIAAVATFFSELPASQVPWPEGLVGVVLASVLTLCCLGIVLAARRRWWAFGLCVVLVVVGGAVAGTRLRVVLHMPADWQFAACDVGQGDAVLVRDAAEVMLVDTGQDPARLHACLSTLGIDRIDTLVITHFDLDHVGGAEVVIGRVDRVVTGPTGSAADEALLRRLADGGADIVPAVSGLRGALGALEWSVLWPPRSSAPTPGNDASVVLAISGAPDCGCLSSVLLGDLGAEAQLRMLARARAELASLGTARVVKVSHHGSADQAARLYEAIGARLGVIGVGAGNTYGHPAPSILSVLAATGTTVARTDLHGLVLAWAESDGSIGLWVEKRAGPEAESADDESSDDKAASVGGRR